MLQINVKVMNSGASKGDRYLFKNLVYPGFIVRRIDEGIK